MPSVIVPKDGSYSREPVERLPTWNGCGQQDLRTTSMWALRLGSVSCPNHGQLGQTLTCGRPPRDLRSQATQAPDAQSQYLLWERALSVSELAGFRAAALRLEYLCRAHANPRLCGALARH